MKRHIKFGILFFLIIASLHTYSSWQFPDLILEGNDTFETYYEPLEQYFDYKNSKEISGVKIMWAGNNCHRGYIATWEINNDSLFLLKVLGYNHDINKWENLNLILEFGKNKVFASWYNGEIKSPRGILINNGFVPIYEKDKIIDIKDGIAVLVTIKEYIEYDPLKIFPYIRFLYDTLASIIYSQIDINKINLLPDSIRVSIYIVFDSNGSIKTISHNIYNPDSEISEIDSLFLNYAEKALQNLPKLMHVTHERYKPPEIRISYHIYCLKNQWDKKHFCKEYR